MSWIDIAKNTQPLATIIIACVALFNVFTIREFQKQNHRPILSIFIRTKKSTNTHDEVELVVKNSGNLPATEIRLVADEQQVLHCVHESAKDKNPYLDDILYILGGKSLNPLIVNGEEDMVEFYRSTGSWALSEKDIWKRKSSFPVKICYKDLNKYKYHSRQTLVID
ncbi:MAG: hypothetical protein ACFB0C_06370 [Leptolyngbyaceae cyanobacterium]